MAKDYKEEEEFTKEEEVNETMEGHYFFLPGSEKYPDDLQRWCLPAKANFVIRPWLLRSLLTLFLMSVDKSSLLYSYS